MIVNANMCTIYTDVAGIHKMPVTIDVNTKMVWFPKKRVEEEQKDPISFLEEECWIELEDGTRIEHEDCDFQGTDFEVCNEG